MSATPRDGEISQRVVPNGTTNELAGLFFTLSLLMLSVMQEAINTTPSEQVIIGKCAVKTLTTENAV